MKESESNIDRTWVLVVLIALYSLNILVHLFCIGLIAYAIINGLVEDGAIFFYYIFIIPISIFFAVLILVFNHEKKNKGVKYENYMLYCPLVFCLSICLSDLGIINTAVFIFSVFGIIISMLSIKLLFESLK